MRTTSDPTREHVPPPSSVRADRGFWICLGVSLVLAIGLMLLSMQASMRFGRLSSYPIWDDIGTFHETTQWVQAFYDHGFGAVVLRYAEYPPHQPYMSVTTFLAYLLFGIHEWSAYAMCWVPIFLLLGCTGWLLNGFPLWQRLLGIGAVATAPMVTYGVQELKPDFFAGACFAMAVVTVLRRPVYTDPKRAAVAAALFAGALLGKPSVFAQTGLLIGFTMFVALLADLTDGRRRPSLRDFQRGSLAFTGVLALLFGPHLLVAGRGMWNYMMLNAFGKQREFWTKDLTPAEHARHYLDGSSCGAVMLGPHLYIAGGLIALGLLAVLVRRRRPEVVRAAAIGLVALAAYGIVSANAYKNHVLGLPFQNLWLLGGVLAMREVRLAWGASARRWSAAGAATGLALVAAFVTGVWLYKIPFGDGPTKFMPSQWRRVEQDRTAMIKDLYTELLSRGAGHGKVVLFANGVGGVNENLLGFWSMRDGEPVRWVTSEITRGEQIRPYLRKADLVIASELGNGLSIDFWDRSKAQDEQLAIVRAHPRFRQVWSALVPGTGKPIYLFEATRTDGFEGFEAVGPGLRPPEGPYRYPYGPHPEWNLPLVRWSSGDEATIRPVGIGPGPATLLLGMTSHEGRWVSIEMGGEVVRRVRLAPHRLKRVAVRLELTTGREEITFRFRGTTAPDRGTVLFRELKIRPGAPERETPDAGGAGDPAPGRTP